MSYRKERELLDKLGEINSKKEGFLTEKNLGLNPTFY